MQETRVSNIEKKVDDLLKTVHRPSIPPRPHSLTPLGYSSGCQGQNWQRSRYPNYYHCGSPNGRQYPQRFYHQDKAGTHTEEATHLRATTIEVHPEIVGIVQVWVVITHLHSILTTRNIVRINMVQALITSIGTPICQVITIVCLAQDTVLLLTSIILRDMRSHPLWPLEILDLSQLVPAWRVGHKVLKLRFVLSRRNWRPPRL